MELIRLALSENLQPLGKALSVALHAGDEVAMRAALRKISAQMPEFVSSSPALAAIMEGEFIAALADDEVQAKGNSDGAFKGWITRRRGGLSSRQNKQRAARLVEWAMKARRDVPNIAHRKGLGWIDLPWGRPGHKAPVIRTDKAGKPVRLTHTDGYGLSHIIDKHGWSAARAIPTVIAHGKIQMAAGDPLKASITHHTKMLVLGRESRDSAFAITSFDHSEHAPQSSKPVRSEVIMQPASKTRTKRRKRQTQRSS